MHLTASLDPTPMRKLSACAKRGGRCHLSRPKGIGFRCIPQLVAPIRVGGVRPRDERSRRLDLSRPFFLANALRPQPSFRTPKSLPANRIESNRLVHRSMPWLLAA